MNRFDFQAVNPERRYGMTKRSKPSETYFPTIPALWPNRAVRRAIKKGAESRIPAEWRQALVAIPNLRAYVKAL